MLDGKLSLDLINFEYMTKIGESMDPKASSNFTFKSIYLLQKNLDKEKISSYKDDMISIFYVLIYLLCDRKHIKMRSLYLDTDVIL